MVDSGELEASLALGREARSIEIKGPGSLSDKAYVATVARAVLAMSNTRDGGLVVLGIDDTTIAQMTPGLGEHLEQWSANDDVNDALARYCDPPVSFDLDVVALSSGCSVVVLSVHEFDREPHLCKKDYPDKLQDGAVYVRPRGKPRSEPPKSSTDMRDLIDLAVAKGVQDFLRKSGPLGGMFTPPQELDTTKFDEEVAESDLPVMWPSVDPGRYALTPRVDRPAYFQTFIRPGPYQADRLQPDTLSDLVEMQAVRLRGWPVPMVDGREKLDRHRTWVGQDLASSLVPHIELWRMFCSGQFLQLRVLATDLRDSPDFRPSRPDATGVIAVWDVLLYAVEVAEFAGRLAVASHTPTVTIVLAIKGTQGRELIAGDQRRELTRPGWLDDDEARVDVELSTAELLADPRTVGVKIAHDLLSQFGVRISERVLLDYQQEVFESR